MIGTAPAAPTGRGGLLCPHGAFVPAPASAHEVAPGILWVRMPLPFTLDHINLWLLDGGDHWAVVDFYARHGRPAPALAALAEAPWGRFGMAVDPLADWLASIDRLRTLDGATLVLPAHNEPFTGLRARLGHSTSWPPITSASSRSWPTPAARRVRPSTALPPCSAVRSRRGNIRWPPRRRWRICTGWTGAAWCSGRPTPAAATG